MLNVLSKIWCVIKNLVAYLLAGIIEAVNAIIAALGATLTFLLALLPSMPDVPEAPDGGILGGLNWLVPLGPLAAGLATVGLLWGSILLIRVALRWVKAL